MRLWYWLKIPPVKPIIMIWKVHYPKGFGRFAARLNRCRITHIWTGGFDDSDRLVNLMLFVVAGSPIREDPWGGAIIGFGLWFDRLMKGENIYRFPSSSRRVFYGAFHKLGSNCLGLWPKRYWRVLRKRKFIRRLISTKNLPQRYWKCRKPVWNCFWKFWWGRKKPFEGSAFKENLKITFIKRSIHRGLPK